MFGKSKSNQFPSKLIKSSSLVVIIHWINDRRLIICACVNIDNDTISLCISIFFVIKIKVSIINYTRNTKSYPGIINRYINNELVLTTVTPKLVEIMNKIGDTIKNNLVTC